MWIKCSERLPAHGQHVLIWVNDKHIFPFPRGNPGDDGEGRSRMCDAVYWSGDVMWQEKLKNGEAKHWHFNKEEYLACGNQWDRWEGNHGFSYITHWQPLPEPPKEDE